MPTKQIALGSVISIETENPAVFTAMGLVPQITPPGRKWAQTDGTVLDDELETDLLGIEEKSEFSFRQLWQPGDANHELVDTAFAAKSIDNWRITYPLETPVTHTFPAQILEIGPESLEPKGVIARVVTLQRTGAIVKA